MQWNEEAIILSARKFGENNLLIEVFAKEKGLYSGLVRGGQSKKKVGIFQPGNVINATWFGRLEEQLGTFSAEMVTAIGSVILTEQLKVQALLSITSLLRKTLPDRNPYPRLYDDYKTFLHSLLEDEHWLASYVKMELLLLQDLGFGLDLSQCAMTGCTTDLKYISPKTGRAVTAEGAKGYEEKLFKLPGFLSDGDYSEADIILALEMSEYFLERNLFFPFNRKLPEERRRFLTNLIKLLKKSIIAA